MIAFLDHRLLGDSPIGRIAEPRHQLVVLGLGFVLFLFEVMQHDAGVGNALKPGQATLHFVHVGRAARRRLDPFGPPRRMPVLLLGETHEDVAPLRVVFASREQAVSSGCLDLAAPHLFDGGEVLGIHRLERQHRRHPGRDEQHLADRAGIGCCAVQIGDQV